MLHERTLPDLTRDLVNQLTDLVRNEARLARAEVGEKIDSFSGALVKLVFAAALGAAGITLALFALAYGLANAMPLWLASLIAAAVAGIGAFFLFQSSRKAITPDLTLPKTAKQVSRDLRLAKEHLP